MSRPQVSIATLGGLRVFADSDRNASALVRRRKPFALLTYLLLAQPAGRFHQRDSLCALLWPESDHVRARASLRQAIAVIESCVGPVVERRGREELRIVPASVGVDVSDFERAIEEGRWEQAVAVYGGAFLDGFYVSASPEFERWVDSLQLRLAASHRRALEKSGGGRALDSGGPGEAHGEAAHGLERLRELAAHPASAGAPTVPTEPRAEADRRRWPWEGRELRPAFAASVLVLGGVWGMSALAEDPGSHAGPLRVAVPPFAHVDESAPIDRHIAALAIAGRVATLDSVEVVGFHELEEALGGAAPLTEAAGHPGLGEILSELDVDVLIRGTLLGSSGGAGHVAVDVIHVPSGRLVGPTIATSRGEVRPRGWQDVADRVATRLVAEYRRPSTAWEHHAMEPNPPPLGAYLALSEAVAAFAAGDAHRAEQQARLALAQDPSFTGAAIEIATQLANQRQYEAADSIVRALRREAGVMPKGDRDRLRWLEAALRGDRAGRALDAETDPSGLASRFQRAYELSNVGRLQASLDVLDEDPGRGLPDFRARELWLRTVNLHRLGQHDRELAIASMYRAELPERAQPWRLEARALAADDATEELEPLYSEAATSTVPFLDAQVAYEAGIEMLAHGREREGARWLTRALERLENPHDGGETILQLHADVLYALGAWEQARDAFERLVADSRDPVRIKGSLAVIHARLGEPARAREIAAELEEGHPADAGNRTMWRARVAAALGEQDRVADLLDLASARGVARPAWVHTYPEWRYLDDRSAVDRWLLPSG